MPRAAAGAGGTPGAAAGAGGRPAGAGRAPRPAGAWRPSGTAAGAGGAARVVGLVVPSGALGGLRHGRGPGAGADSAKASGPTDGGTLRLGAIQHHTSRQGDPSRRSGTRGTIGRLPSLGRSPPPPPPDPPPRSEGEGGERARSPCTGCHWRLARQCSASSTRALAGKPPVAPGAGSHSGPPHAASILPPPSPRAAWGWGAGRLGRRRKPPDRGPRLNFAPEAGPAFGPPTAKPGVAMARAGRYARESKPGSNERSGNR